MAFMLPPQIKTVKFRLPLLIYNPMQYLRSFLVVNLAMYPLVIVTADFESLDA